MPRTTSYFNGLAADLQAKRDRLAEACAALGLGVIPCQGTYFLTLDMSPLGLEGDDAALARRMTVEAGVTAVPVSAFYVLGRADATILRLCFSKRDAVLDEAVERMRALAGSRLRRTAA